MSRALDRHRIAAKYADGLDALAGHHGGGGGGHHGGHGHGGGGWGWRGGWGVDYDDDDDYVVVEPQPQVVVLPVTTVKGADSPEDIARNKRVSDRAMQMAKLKEVTGGIGMILVKQGSDAINQAIAIATKNNLPGPTARQKVKDRLTTHQAALGTLMLTPDVMYPQGPDLKSTVLQAFTELDAAQEGAEYIAKLWSEMWDEIAEELKKLPAEITKKVGDVAKAIVPTWVWWTAGAAAVGLVGAVGFGLYKRARGR
jgi:hypothetical protein